MIKLEETEVVGWILIAIPFIFIIISIGMAIGSVIDTLAILSLCLLLCCYPILGTMFIEEE